MEPEVLPKVAVIVAVPVDPAVASPCDPFVLLMRATDVADVLQVTAVVKSCVRLSAYTPVATNCCEVDMAILGLDGVTSIAIRAGLAPRPLVGVSVELLEPPPLQPVTSAKTRKKRRILLDFTNAYSRRYQVGYISPALQVPHMPPFFDDDMSRLYVDAPSALFAWSLPQGFLVFASI